MNGTRKELKREASRIIILSVSLAVALSFVDLVKSGFESYFGKNMSLVSKSLYMIFIFLIAMLVIGLIYFNIPDVKGKMH